MSSIVSRWRLVATILVGVVLALLAADRFLPSLLARELPRATRVLVVKSERQLRLYSGDEEIAHYSVSLGASPIGHKAREGDERTPEGQYVLDWRNDRSRYYRSIHVSYPDATDRALAEAAGVSPGGAIMIHGLPNGLGWLGSLLARWDWTDGCIAVSNTQMEEVWRAVPNGTPIEIRP